MVDPAEELSVDALRDAIRVLLESSSISIPESHAGPRMRERHVTAAEIVGCLRSGTLSTEGFARGAWRYRARARGITVIFTFDIDDDGNVIVIVTTWREK